MPYQLGTDEAGYGPNLGPLVITGTLWKTQQLQSPLYQHLENCCSLHRTPEKIHVADSKKVYQGKLENLETGVLAILYSIYRSIPPTLQELSELVNVALDWKAIKKVGFPSVRLPIAANPEQVEALGNNLAFQSNVADLKSIQCQILLPQRFNEQLEKFGNKASLLSATTLNLVQSLLEIPHQLNDHPFELLAVCDKHGGRSSYAGLLQQYVTGGLIQTLDEGREQSIYRWDQDRSQIEIQFRTGGESFFPTAVASMFSKYIREVFMDGWNQFWKRKIPDLKPTKGYPADAKRFYAEIEPLLDQINLEKHQIWRRR